MRARDGRGPPEQGRPRRQDWLHRGRFLLHALDLPVPAARTWAQARAEDRAHRLAAGADRPRPSTAAGRAAPLRRLPGPELGERNPLPAVPLHQLVRGHPGDLRAGVRRAGDRVAAAQPGEPVGGEAGECGAAGRVRGVEAVMHAGVAGGETERSDPAGSRPLLLAGLVFGESGFAPCVPGWARAEAAMSAACSGWGWWSGAWPGSLLLVVAASLCLSTRQESLSRPGCICAEKERVA